MCCFDSILLSQQTRKSLTITPDAGIYLIVLRYNPNERNIPQAIQWWLYKMDSGTYKS